MVNAEIRHGNFLAYFLDPQRPHGFGVDLLKGLLVEGLGGNLLGLTDLDIRDAEVRREWRSIDLVVLLHARKLVVPIELKIDARQGGDQLKRYRSLVEATWPCKEGWKHYCVFLTKNNEVPLDAAWHPMRLGHVAKCLASASAARRETAVGAIALNSYLDMLRRNHLEDKKMEEFARRIWAQHGQALTFLTKHQPNRLAEFHEILVSREQGLAVSASSDQYHLTVDGSARNVIRFAFSEWDVLKGFLSSSFSESKRLVLVQLVNTNTRIEASLYIMAGQSQERDQYVDALFPHRLNRDVKRAGKEWVGLAKEVVFDPRSDDFDFEDAYDATERAMRLFCERVFEHFNPLLSRFR